MKSKEAKKYDAIIIGSGIGSLTTASILAKIGKKRVLILEKHWTVGGLTHQFERGKYSWEVGIHYVGQAVGASIAAKTFQYISDGKLEWERIAAPYDTFVYPDMKFEVPENEQEYIGKLVGLFPEEKKAIKQYFKDVKAIARWGISEYMRPFTPGVISGMLGFLGRRGKKLASMTMQSYLDTHFKDDKLKALLVSQWGDYGVQPKKSAFFIHSLIVGHYMEGAYYPKGGSQRIAETVLPGIKAEGGDYLLNCEVKEILVENGAAVGCRCMVKRGREVREEIFYAPLVVSGAGAYPTYRKMLREPLFDELEQLQSRDSMIVVYLGLKDNPERLGVKGGNLWIFEHYDHNAAYPQTPQDNLEELPICFVSFPSLKDRSRDAHTAELITVLPYDFFKQWAHLDWKQRGEDYEQLKQKIAQQLIKMVEKTLPGFADMVDFVEVATPLSMEKFTGRTFGAQYGVPQTPERLRSQSHQAKTPIKNLYLTGGDVYSLGLVGAMMGGVSAACTILGNWSFTKVMPAIMGAKPKAVETVSPNMKPALG